MTVCFADILWSHTLKCSYLLIEYSKGKIFRYYALLFGSKQKCTFRPSENFS